MCVCVRACVRVCVRACADISDNVETILETCLHFEKKGFQNGFLISTLVTLETN